MAWWPVPLLRLLARLAPDALDAGAAEEYAFITDEQLLEVAVVAGGVAARAQLYYSRAFLSADPVGARRPRLPCMKAFAPSSVSRRCKRRT